MLAPLLGSAQEVRVIPELERSTILIGEQVDLKIRLVYPHDGVARLVLPEDTLMMGVEIVESNLVDSTIINDRLRELIYNVVITSFDSATYQLRNIDAMVNGEVYTATDAPSLIVNTVPVHLEPDVPIEYYDIKAQWKPKFVWQDYLNYIALFIGLIALALGIYLLIQQLRKRKGVEEAKEAPIPLLDPYEEALQGMQELKSKELWEHQQVKEYYTEMTNILRRYLWRVYGISTLDKTSGEILAKFRESLGKERMYVELSRILQTADLAKFAKYQPDADENVSLLSASLAFIEEHKPMDQSDEATGEESGKEEKGGEA